MSGSSSGQDVGRYFVAPVHGLVRRVGTREHEGVLHQTFEIIAGGGTLVLPDANVAKALRDLVAPAEARRSLEILRSKVELVETRPPNVRWRDQIAALHYGTLSDQVSELHRMYRSRTRATFGERRTIEMLERVTLPELAHVCDQRRDVLQRELRAMHPAFDPNAPERAPEARQQRPSPSSPIPAPGHAYFGTFEVAGSALLLGALTSSTAPEWMRTERTHVSAARNGVWHGYVRRDGVPALVAIHEDRLSSLLALAAEARVIRTVHIERMALHIADAAMRDDDAYHREAFPALYADGLLLGRGCWSTTFAGDDADTDTYEVRGVTEGDELVLAALTPRT